MFVLMPTCDTHAPIAQVSAALLDRYWAGHPPVYVLHDAVRPRIAGATLCDSGHRDGSPWLGRMIKFLGERSDDQFVLLLDDYALCGPARTDLIDAGAQLMRQDPTVGLFPLCWYPATARMPRPGFPGMVTLTGTPILLQAAIWRRSWFLELADRMDPRTSPWSFEAAATQRARTLGREICAVPIPEPKYLGGHLIDAFDKTDWPLPYHNLMRRGRPEEGHEAFLHEEGFSFPSRGLGDTVAGLARATGAARIAHAYQRATGRSCGCGQRRERLNELLRYDRS